jgi:hypothetical protein
MLPKNKTHPQKKSKGGKKIAMKKKNYHYVEVVNPKYN